MDVLLWAEGSEGRAVECGPGSSKDVGVGKGRCHREFDPADADANLGANFEQLQADGAGCGVGEAGRGQGDATQRADKDIGHGGQPKPQLVGAQHHGDFLLNISLGSALSFTYNHRTDFLEVGGLADTARLVQFSPSTDDFVLQINGFGAGDPTFNQVVYAQVSSANIQFFTIDQTGSVSVTPITSGVPEPSTWAMMILCLAGIGFFAHRRRKNGAVTVCTRYSTRRGPPCVTPFTLRHSSSSRCAQFSGVICCDYFVRLTTR